MLPTFLPNVPSPHRPATTEDAQKHTSTFPPSSFFSSAYFTITTLMHSVWCDDKTGIEIHRRLNSIGKTVDLTENLFTRESTKT